MTTALLRVSLSVLAIVAFAAPARAAVFIMKPDEVVFKNGERVVGRIKGVVDGKITIESDSMGAVSAPLDKVATFSADEELTIVLQGGTVVKQKIDSAEDGNIKLSADGVLHPQTISISKIEKINPPPVKWTGSIVAGYTASRGNSDTDAANIDINAQRRGDDDRMTFGAGYATTRQKDTTTHIWKTTTDRYFGGLQYDYFFSKVVYGYANARAEKDRIANLDLRFLAGAGAGEQWAESAAFNFSTEEGVAWLSENFSNNTPANDQMTLRLAYHVNGSPAGGVKLFHNLDWYPGLESSDDQFIVTDAGANVSLTSSMFAQFKVEVRYDNTPAIGSERTDTRTTVGIGWSF